MAVVTASNGETYHLFSLPDRSTSEFEESIGFTELENDLSDGYYAQTLFGSATGLREFRLTLPTLAHHDLALPEVEGIDNDILQSREQYIWDLYSETKVTGQPFVFRSRRNGQNYLVRFNDKRLTYRGMQCKLYSTGIELKQVRIKGATVFDAGLIPKHKNTIAEYNEKGGHSGGEWFATISSILGTESLIESGDVVVTPAGQNSLEIVQLNQTTNNAYLTTGLVGSTLYDLFIVMRMREATFSNAAGIFGNTDDINWVIGESGTTKFADTNSVTLFSEYRMNGRLYASTDRQAPMNKWGVVHLRFPGTDTIAAGVVGQFLFGASNVIATNFAEVDFGNILMNFDDPLPLSISREVTEHLAVKWGVGSQS